MKWGIRDYLIIPIQCAFVAIAVLLAAIFLMIVVILGLLDDARGVT